MAKVEGRVKNAEMTEAETRTKNPRQKEELGAEKGRTADPKLKRA
jgi:hypothetical protein